MAQGRKPRRWTFHVVYWEAGDAGRGITFDAPVQDDRPLPRVGPAYCDRCLGVSDPWRFRLDAVHASLRMLAKEGTGFREEVEDFVCVSPKMVMEYHLSRWHAYNTIQKKKVLTQNVVLGAPLRVKLGDVEPLECGVGVTELSNKEGAEGVENACKWLTGYAARIRNATASSGGVAALVVVHPRGVEVNGFGVSRSFFASNPTPPITHVVLLVAGPDGFGHGLPSFESALMGRGTPTGCHLGPLRVRVPSVGGTNAALGDLFMCHDRELLMPILEDLRVLGHEEYAAWVKLLRDSLTFFGMATVSVENKMDLLENFSGALERLGPSAADPPEDTPADVDAKIEVLERAGLLPMRSRSWRAQMWIDSSEPSQVLNILDVVPSFHDELEKRWHRVADFLENNALRMPPDTAKTQKGVLRSLRSAAERLHVKLDGALPVLKQLPCLVATEVIEHFAVSGFDAEDPLVALVRAANRRLQHQLDDPKPFAGEDSLAPSARPHQPAHPPPAWLIKNPGSEVEAPVMPPLARRGRRSRSRGGRRWQNHSVHVKAHTPYRARPDSKPPRMAHSRFQGNESARVDSDTLEPRTNSIIVTDQAPAQRRYAAPRQPAFAPPPHFTKLSHVATGLTTQEAVVAPHAEPSLVDASEHPQFHHSSPFFEPSLLQAAECQEDLAAPPLEHMTLLDHLICPGAPVESTPVCVVESGVPEEPAGRWEEDWDNTAPTNAWAQNAWTW